MNFNIIFSSIKSSVILASVICSIFLLTGCTEQIEHIGYVPAEPNMLVGKNIQTLGHDIVIAPDIQNKNEFYIGQFAFKVNKIRIQYILLSSKIYKLICEKNIITQVIEYKANVNEKTNIILPISPAKENIFSKLFNDVGFVRLT